MAERRMTVEEAQAKLPELLEQLAVGDRLVIEREPRARVALDVQAGRVADGREWVDRVRETAMTLDGLGDEFADVMEQIVAERSRDPGPPAPELL